MRARLYSDGALQRLVESELVGLTRIRSGTAILPKSWKEPLVGVKQLLGSM
jgi:hypothetical protein